MSDETVPKNDENNDSESEESIRQSARRMALDLGDDCLHNVDSNRLGLQVPSGSAGTQESSSSNTNKRDENPFSFKHFLKDSSNSNRNYQSLGARPKIYRDTKSNNRHVTPPESPSRRQSQNTRKIGEFSSALPDFVQDHLVIEQCFLGNQPNTTSNFNLDLPDFTRSNERMPNGPVVSRANSIEELIPLDLPGLSLGNSFPLDLPLSANPTSADLRTTSVEVGSSKSLPDFLTDGPVRTNVESIAPSPCAVSGDAPRDVPRCHYCSDLTLELNNVRQRLSRAEDEAERNYRRMTAADNTIAKLKQELKNLKAQLRHLQSENRALREGDSGAVGGGGDPSLELQAQRLAQELRAAASTAEHSLRSLLTGVDNLRIMASSLENIHRIEERPTDRFSRFDDDSAGPAL